MSDVEGFFDCKEDYKDFAVPWKRGIILHGLPGNGKTISIKALMHSLSSRTNPIPTLYGEYENQRPEAYRGTFMHRKCSCYVSRTNLGR